MSTQDKRTSMAVVSEPAFILITTPKEVFSDGESLHIETRLTWDDLVSKLKAIADEKESECAFAMAIAGTVLPLKSDFSAVQYQAVEYPIKQDTREFIEGFVSVDRS